jgi:prolyl-tRNA editing enzyme YbaK/EbsC (Cys-tRNA(Pro) deacylase)
MLVGSPIVPTFWVHSSRVQCESGTLPYPTTGVPPFGHSTQLRVFVDSDLLQYDEVWAAAGTWNDNFGANPNDIVSVSGGVVTDLKRA